MPEPVILCSVFDEEHKLVCDLPIGHKGTHRGSATWGDKGDTYPGYERKLDEHLRRRP